MSYAPNNRPCPREIQARRIRWTTGLPSPLDREVARLAFGEAR